MDGLEHGQGTSAIVAEHLCKRYGDTVAVHDVSLTVGAGEIVGIVGVNGAGKTTTVESIAGLRALDRGTVRVLGLDPRRDRPALRQVLGVQLQRATFHHALTARELVDLYRSFYPDPVPTAELLHSVALSDRGDTRFENLSGGQQQRLSVALALVGRPRVVILDELTTGLDPRARRRMWSTIGRLGAEGVAVLLVSHAMEEIEHLCARVVLLDRGRVVTVGTPAGIVESTGAANLDDAFVALTGRDLGETQ
ncbi:ABC transporter ATP-binding protein [Rhodococcus sp. NPDC047139]|uniref:ABC transporter ATP-binding protein n=1 Tax=Rhodococcus sp. NPDC047139 TaxID=3155141 RepID=UPI0033D5D7F1